MRLRAVRKGICGQIPEVVQEARLQLQPGQGAGHLCVRLWTFQRHALPKTDKAKFLVAQAVSQLRAASAALAALRNLAASLPEHPVVMEMFGVGPALGPQLMAEIGDVRRFYAKKALVAFAGIDAPPYRSGQMEVRSRSISKRGSSALRRTLFLVMSAILRCSPADEPVYQFMDKKRAEGKPYRVYMMASANKFLRIYYATVKQHLDSLEA